MPLTVINQEQQISIDESTPQFAPHLENLQSQWPLKQKSQTGFDTIKTSEGPQMDFDVVDKEIDGDGKIISASDLFLPFIVTVTVLGRSIDIIFGKSFDPFLKSNPA